MKLIQIFLFSHVRQALKAREKVLGENHPSVGTALNNLAVVLCLQVFIPGNSWKPFCHPFIRACKQMRQPTNNLSLVYYEQEQ